MRASGGCRERDGIVQRTQRAIAVAKAPRAAGLKQPFRDLAGFTPEQIHWIAALEHNLDPIQIVYFGDGSLKLRFNPSARDRPILPRREVRGVDRFYAASNRPLAAAARIPVDVMPG